MRRVVLCLLAGLGLAGAAGPAIAADPWVVPADAALALRDPDRFAWQMFVALTWPADPSSRLPASDRPYGDPGPVMFETWAMSDQVFLSKGAAPPAWEDIDWADRTLSAASVPRQIALFRDVAAVKSGSVSDEQEEVRLNRPAFDYIRDNGLYSVEGQQWFFYNRQPIAFPLGAIAVQTVWRPIGEEDKARYQWQEFRDPKRKRPYLYGLTALHIQSKVLPHWFWATFEHVDNPYRPGLYDEGWLTPSRDSVACPASELACNKAPAGFGLEGTRWENYRLRGTQIDYVDDDGNPTILANSELELGFQQSSSCMSCHVRSTIGPNRNAPASYVYNADNKAHEPAPPAAMRLPVFKVDGDGRVTGYTGQPQPDEFLLPGQAAGGQRPLPGARFRLGADAGRERQQRQVANFPACFANEHRLSPTAAEVGPPCGRGGAIPK